MVLIKETIITIEPITEIVMKLVIGAPTKILAIEIIQIIFQTKKFEIFLNKKQQQDVLVEAKRNTLFTIKN